MKQRICMSAVCTMVALLYCSSIAFAASSTTRISKNTLGQEPDGSSWNASMSSDGRYIVYESVATDISAENTDVHSRIIFFDTKTSTTEFIDKGYLGQVPTSGSYLPSISDDGNIIAFQSSYAYFMPYFDPSHQDIFVRDRTAPDHSDSPYQVRVNELISANTLGNLANGSSSGAVMSSDGRYIAFQSSASDLIASDGNSQADIFVRDRLATPNPVTERVSVADGGGDPDGASYNPVISADGRYVAFHSWASNLTATTDAANYLDVFVYDRDTGTTERISVKYGSVDDEANGHSTFAAISADGRYVSFASDASDLVANDTNSWVDVFLRDRVAGTTEIVSLNDAGEQQNNPGTYSGYGGAVSADGRYVVFPSTSTNLVDGDTNNKKDIFRRDRWQSKTIRVNVANDGSQQTDGNTLDEYISITSDGSQILFTSSASDFVTPNDATDTVYDVFMRKVIPFPWPAFLPAIIKPQE